MKLSIIVPIYNVEKYLDKCIRSLINQKLTFDYEIILVNDGSIDKSEDIITKYLKNSKIIYINKKNGGLSDARNAGLRIAKGKYIGFVDSDDYIDLNMYRILLKKIEYDQSDMAICGISRVDIDGKELRSYIPKNKSFKEVLNNAYAVNKIYKKELFNNMEFPLGKHYEDLFTIPKLYLKAKGISIVKEKLYYYLERDGAITMKRDNPRIIDIIQAYLELKSYILENNFEEQINKDFQEASIEMKNHFLLKTISGYSIKYFNENQSKIMHKFQELTIWKKQDFFKLYLAKYFPKNYIKKIIKK